MPPICLHSSWCFRLIAWLGNTTMGIRTGVPAGATLALGNLARGKCRPPDQCLLVEQGGVMPRLSNEQHKRIIEARDVQERILRSFVSRQYMSMNCRFCNWASNEHTPDLAIEANRNHEATHIEKVEWDAHLLPGSLIMASFHDHDCQMGLCSCRCGCKEGPFCSLTLGSLCSTCYLQKCRENTGHEILA